MIVKRFLTSVCCIGLMGAFLVTTSFADLTQNPNASNGFFSDVNSSQSIADDFVVADGGKTLATIEWWGGYFAGNLPLQADQFTINIFADAGGLPGAANLGPGFIGSADSRVDTGVDLFGVDEYLYSYDLGSLNLAAGAYWVEIFNNSAKNPTETWFWETGDLDPVNGRANSAFATENPGVNWANINGGGANDNQAFRLTNAAAIPEPSSAAVLIFLGLAALRRRQK